MECLLTKLRGSASNVELPKLGAMNITITQNPSLSGGVIDIYIKPSETIKVSGYCSTGSDSPDTYQTVEIQSGQQTLHCKNIDQVIEIENKYALQRIEPVTSANKYYIAINANDLEYTEQLEVVDAIISGRLAALNKSTLLRINASDSPITGVLSDLSNAVELGRIDISKTNIFGTIEDFVSGQVASGRNSPSNPILSLGLLFQVKFGGNNYGRSFDSFGLTWNMTSKIIVGLGGRNESSWTTVYAKGATSEEISAWQQAGKTVVVIE